jgi:hypothetical protein
MTKIAVIIGGVLLLAGAALAGGFAGLDSSKTPTIGQSFAPASSTTSVDDRGTTTVEDRGRENELRGRENEVGEDISGPCDEAEHANDPRCTGVNVPRADDDNDDRFDDRRGHGGRNDNSGPGNSHEDRSGHGGGDDD